MECGISKKMKTNHRTLPHNIFLYFNSRYPDFYELDYLFDDIGGLRDVIMYHPMVQYNLSLDVMNEIIKGTILPFGSGLADITGMFGEFEEL